MENGIRPRLRGLVPAEPDADAINAASSRSARPWRLASDADQWRVGEVSRCNGEVGVGGVKVDGLGADEHDRVKVRFQRVEGRRAITKDQVDGMKRHRASRGDSTVLRLITRRSQVQILPPPLL